MASRGMGPAAFYATALWLRGAFSDLDGAGTVSQVMPPTGRTFSVTHTHWFRHADGRIIEHWARKAANV